MNTQTTMRKTPVPVPRGKGGKDRSAQVKPRHPVPLDRVPLLDLSRPEFLAVAEALARAGGAAPSGPAGGDAPASIESVQTLLEAVLALLTQATAPTIWTVEQIAEWLKIPKATMQIYVVSRPDFPAPLRPTGKKDGQKRYFAADVIAWARTAAEEVPE